MRKRSTLALGAALVAGAALVMAPAAQATITIDLKNDHSPTEENIMFETAATIPALSITGDTNRTNSPVIFDTNFTAGVGTPGPGGGPGTGQFIAAQGIGQANIECMAGGTTACVPVSTGGFNGHLLNSLEMRPGAGFAWTDVVANPDFGEGTMNVFAQDNMGNNFDFVLTNGSNFFTLTASGGEVITDVKISQEVGSTGTFGWNEFDQPRVSGVCTLVGTTCTPILTPEPASLALLGTALAGWGWAWRRRQRARPAASGVA